MHPKSEYVHFHTTTAVRPAKEQVRIPLTFINVKALLSPFYKLIFAG